MTGIIIALWKNIFLSGILSEIITAIKDDGWKSNSFPPLFSWNKNPWKHIVVELYIKLSDPASATQALLDHDLILPRESCFAPILKLYHIFMFMI